MKFTIVTDGFFFTALLNKSYFYFQSSKFLQWQDHYLRGTGMEVYTEQFSESFHGKSFPQVAEWVTNIKAAYFTI